MLIPRKSHSRDESRNSRVSIKTRDFTRVRTFTCVIGVGSPAGARREGEITGRTRRRCWPMTGPHRRLRMINVAGGGAPKMAGGRVRGTMTGKTQWRSASRRWDGESPGNQRLPPSYAAGQSVDVVGGMGA